MQQNLSSARRKALKHKLGQLLMVGFDGLTPTEHVLYLIQEWHLGGVILFRRNVADLRQIADLNSALQSAALNADAPPLFIAIDQEGGMVARIKQGVTPLPSAMAFARAGRVEDCETLTRLANEELLALGINVNFAPVLDVNNNPRNPVIGVRAFGETVADVCKYGLAALRGVQASGVLATAKHFPGHGDTEVDSHLGLPCVRHGRARLDEIELQPFKAAIAAGVEAIMSAHVVFPAIEPDPDTPSTLSKAVLTGLLREELGFSGLIFTDCLEMSAIADGIGVVEGALRAIEAGADIALVSHRPDRQLMVLDALLQAVESGRIPEDLIDSTLARIQAAKQLRLESGGQATPAQWRLIGDAERRDLAVRVQQDALWVRQAVRPLDAQSDVLVVSFQPPIRTEIDEVEDQTPSLGKVLAKRGISTRELLLPLTLTDTVQNEVFESLRPQTQCIVVSYNAVLHPTQRTLLDRLPADRLWHVAGRLPYDLESSPACNGQLAAFANTALALESVVQALIKGAAAN